LHNIKFYSFFIIVGIIISSCSKEDYEAQIPTYISIDNISLTTDQLTEGSASSNIVDAWVFINDDFVGVYELPAKFPVLKEGNKTIKVYAGIKDNGISTTRKKYLLYSPYEEQIDLVKGETITLNPVVTYQSSANFTWIEDFENPSLSFLYTSGSDTIINKTSSNVFEGSYSGEISLTDNMDFFEATSVGYSTIPRQGQPVYLELDFKTNEQLTLGVYIGTSQQALVTLNTTSSWKKIYINLTELINAGSSTAEVKVFLGIREGSGVTFLTSNPEIYIDNIKLVHL